MLAALAATTLTQTACHAQGSDFRTMPSGLQYKIVKDAPGQTALLGDYMDIHLSYGFRRANGEDTILFDSRKLNNNQPVPLQVQRPGFGGDVMEAMTFISEGDSAIVKVPLDSLLKMGAPMMPGMEKDKGQTLDYRIQVVRVRSAAQVKADQDAQAARQNGVDDALIQNYLKKNGINAKRTASGLYYTIAKPGAGAALTTGNQITMKYTGRTLEGTTFDSNVDSNFHHVQPFTFGLGMGQVIRGWDEGIALFKKGGKGTLYIPSPMAYGDRSPSPLIPANAVLVFDVEVVDVAQGTALPSSGNKPATTSTPTQKKTSKPTPKKKK
jgi:FKBP-type peptidyl-prolyl cis-trans isomerase